jgi:hypothetical protein
MSEAIVVDYSDRHNADVIHDLNNFSTTWIIMNLTEVEFWENYWGDENLPSGENMCFPFDRCLANALKK